MSHFVLKTSHGWIVPLTVSLFYHIVTAQSQQRHAAAKRNIEIERRTRSYNSFFLSFVRLEAFSRYEDEDDAEDDDDDDATDDEVQH